MLGLGFACRGAPTTPPYPEGGEPTGEQLLGVMAPQFETIQVPRAKIRFRAGLPSVGLELVAQAPSRFAGRVHAAGNEIVQLAVHEELYALRMVESRPGTLATGFYRGPPSTCAVQQLIGVPLSPRSVAALLLGGGPLVDGGRIVSQGWNKKPLEPRGATRAYKRKRRREGGRERLNLESDTHRQIVEFAWVEGGWVFAGASLWSLGEGAQWEWTITHHDLRRSPDGVLPRRTQIHQGDGEGGLATLTITYAETVVNPTLPGTEIETADEWDDEGWEDDESEDPEPPEESVPEPAPEPIPPAFVLDSAGLVDRGDLCER